MAISGENKGGLILIIVMVVGAGAWSLFKSEDKPAANKISNVAITDAGDKVLPTQHEEPAPQQLMSNAPNSIANTAQTAPVQEQVTTPIPVPQPSTNTQVSQIHAPSQSFTVKGNHAGMSNIIVSVVGNTITLSAPSNTVLPESMGIETIYSARQECKKVSVQQLSSMITNYSCNVQGDMQAINRALKENSQLTPTFSVVD